MTDAPAYAECPACAAVFRVPPDLRGAPRVRCGACGAAFDLAPALVDEPWAVRRRAEGVAGAEGEVVGAPHAPPGPAPRPAVPLRANAPVELPPAGPRLGRFLGGTLLVLLLGGLLVAQVAYFARDALAARPGLRPLAEQVCAYARCTLSPWRELDALAIEDARVRAHPDARDALLATATLVNRARFAQPAPALLVRLRDGQGTVIGARRFAPREYLAPPAGGELAPGARATVRLALVDVPGARDFSFDLRW
jgi:predicted Zn finger-like uncharacterized protein